MVFLARGTGIFFCRPKTTAARWFLDVALECLIVPEKMLVFMLAVVVEDRRRQKEKIYVARAALTLNSFAHVVATCALEAVFGSVCVYTHAARFNHVHTFRITVSH